MASCAARGSMMNGLGRLVDCLTDRFRPAALPFSQSEVVDWAIQSMLFLYVTAGERHIAAGHHQCRMVTDLLPSNVIAVTK
jgi:hypothetical protein